MEAVREQVGSEEIREQAFRDWKKKMKYREIAEKYGVTESAVKSWAKRYWKTGRKKVAKTGEKKSQDSLVKPKSKGGAPKGNRNAAGSHPGAPIGNRNSLKHGLYSKALERLLTEEERERSWQYSLKEAEEQLRSQIELSTNRETFLLNQIADLHDAGRGTAPEWMERQAQEAPKTPAVSPVELLQRFEAELTRVQKAKTKDIEILARLQTLRGLETGESDGLPEALAKGPPPQEMEQEDAKE